MTPEQETLQQKVDQLVPELGNVFYRMHEGFQDPVGAGRRLITHGVLEQCAKELMSRHETLDPGEFVINLVNRVALLPQPIGADYRAYRRTDPFPPHLICYALAYIKHSPEPRFTAPLTNLIVRTGWWAGDENCIDDLLDSLPDKSEVCRIAADSLLHPESPKALFAAGQLLYHLRYGEDWGLREYVKEQYEKALRGTRNSDYLKEIRSRLKTGLTPWRTLRP